MTGAQVPVAPKAARRCANKRSPIRGEAFHSERRFARALLVGSVLTEMLARFVRPAFFKSLQPGPQPNLSVRTNRKLHYFISVFVAAQTKLAASSVLPPPV